MNLKTLLDKVDDLETMAINKIQKTCCDDCQHAASRATEELTTGLRKALRTSLPILPIMLDPNGTVTPIAKDN